MCDLLCMFLIYINDNAFCILLYFLPFSIELFVLKFCPCCYRYLCLLLFIATKYSVIFVCYILRAHSSSGGPLGCFQF